MGLFSPCVHHLYGAVISLPADVENLYSSNNSLQLQPSLCNDHFICAVHKKTRKQTSLLKKIWKEWETITLFKDPRESFMRKVQNQSAET